MKTIKHNVQIQGFQWTPEGAEFSIPEGSDFEPPETTKFPVRVVVYFLSGNLLVMSTERELLRGEVFIFPAKIHIHSSVA